MNLLDQIMQKVRKALAAELEGIQPVERTDKPKLAEGQNRAIHIEHLFEQVRMWSYENYEVGYLTNFYIEDDGSMWAIFDKGGTLYRAQVSVASGKVNVGSLQEVVATYEPVNTETEQRAFTIKREADGTIRFALIAATAVINRDGEIDSTTLFDNMIRRAEEMDIYPRIDFYHLGPVSPEWFEIGQVDVLAREGITYIASGTLNPDHPLTRAIVRAYEDGSETWGASIEYYPFTDSEEEIEVGTTKVTVYTDGINTRISILPEQHACSMFTALAVQQRMSDMNERQKAALIKALGEDEAEKLIQAANLRTTEADEKGLIYRDTDNNQQPEAGTNPKKDKPEEGAAIEVELDEETIKAIAGRVAELLKAGEPAKDNQPVAEVVKAVAELQRSLSALQKDITEIVEVVNDLQEDEEAKQRQWLADLPQEKYRITYRPRVARAEPEKKDGPEDEDLTVEDIASNALAALGWQ